MNYRELEHFLEKKKQHADVEIIGKSVFDRYIYSVSFNFDSYYTVLIQASIHAREHITTDLVCKLIDDVSKNFEKLKTLNMPNIVFVPMVNPDGVQLCYDGVKSAKKNFRKFLIEINGGSDFSLYKANAHGVDLNTNFDAKWGRGKENKVFPSSAGYIGEMPMSEPEVQSLSLLTLKIKPFFTISYHAKGQEIYYDFYNKPENLKRDKKIAKMVARSLRYKIKSVEESSSGGYKDWCIYRLNIPSVTIEVGKDCYPHPIRKDKLKQIYLRNKGIIKLLSKILKEYTNG